ncbi:MAG: glycoside hydrolase TIM-barrel-like domain-containing protein, partial [Rhodobacteraceae bacterium]|nr:glycoside hydrolase TIM-barrel-like domain-containing protein [Paracoccaceae bacterium]
GEGFDWYYTSQAHRDAQIRTPIADTAHGEDWVFRYKDIRNWWDNEHFDRTGGTKAAAPTEWVPRSKPIWFTEFGCPAVDKGTNEPNKFLDPKSSESALPHYSLGRRDDLIQMQYLRAVIDYWRRPENNPVSDVYSGQMIDMDHAHVWAWDARPFPLFPANSDLWSDAENYARGHWISGRVTAQPLSSVVAEICARSGLSDVDVSGLFGAVRGYLVADIGSGRAALQPLMLAHGFEALERDGRLVFRMRDGQTDAEVTSPMLAVTEAFDGPLELSRAPEAEIAGRIRLTYVEAEGDYDVRSVEAIFPDEEAKTTAQSELPLALTRSEGQRIVERWLSEARVARDSARFALPPSLAHIGAGDVVRLGENGVSGDFRIDRLEHAGAISVESVRVEPAIYQPSDEAEERVTPRSFAVPVPVFSLFLDLPLLSGQEVPHAPHLAVTATPWPGSVAAYSSDSDAGYRLNTLLSGRSVIGQSQTALLAAAPGRWDRGAPLRIEVAAGALSSVGIEQLLNGANLMAIGDGSSDNWELFQFADATLVAPNVYDLTRRLRGQAGSDAAAPVLWPAGSYVVLLNGAPKQIVQAAAERDLARHYRIGPAKRGYDDPSYTHRIEAFAGIGLRPLSPVHLRARRQMSGDLGLSWIRRTRTDGDNWSAVEVPLGEAREVYVLRVVQGGAIRRETSIAQPSWTYPAALQAADSVAAPFEIHVAQLSDAFGPGPFARTIIDV